MSMMQIFNRIYENNKTCCGDLKKIQEHLVNLIEENKLLKNQIVQLQSQIKRIELQDEGVK